MTMNNISTSGGLIHPYLYRIAGHLTDGSISASIYFNKEHTGIV